MSDSQTYHTGEKLSYCSARNHKQLLIANITTILLVERRTIAIVRCWDMILVADTAVDELVALVKFDAEVP